VSESDEIMRGYYRTRAPVYDRVYAYPERQADLARLTETLPPLFRDRRVLEVAAGTGFWTEKIAVWTRSVLATDVTPETLAELARRELPVTVTTSVADAYSLADLGERFDGLFAGLWFSHVPVSRRSAFFESIHSVLEPGAQVALVDNSRAQCERLPISHSDSEGNTYQDRETDDGEVHRVLKNFPDEATLRRLVEDLAAEVRYEALDHFWVFRYRLDR
jgi:demethylmenaquinone methyltransferase/2-methoxy-6-polyprenyl-1,4-benzoquinol methylase